MTEIHFHKISSKKTVRGNCSQCNKKCQKTYVAYQTMNPFNRNKNKEPKTSLEIRQENEADVERQSKSKLLCSSCEQNEWDRGRKNDER